jgi:misacylated tRNA(Ala) deacylase
MGLHQARRARAVTTYCYQSDSYATSLSTEVLSCQSNESGFRVELVDTLLCPEAGGQPADAGRIDGQAVLALQKGEQGQVFHQLAEPVDGEVEVELDWARRFDHMQQHTAQHLITALALDTFGHWTSSFHLGAERCDIELDTASLSAEQLAELSEMVNAAIRRALPITCRWVEQQEFERLPVRTRGLPEGFAGPYRLVEIDGIDLNTCGGTHVGSTSELQAVVLAGTEALRGGTRLHFLAGGRVLDMLGRRLEREHEFNELLSCGPGDHLAAVERLKVDQKRSARHKKRLQQELADALASELTVHRGPGLVHRSDPDMPFLQMVARSFKKLRPDGWALMCGGEQQGVFVLVGPADRIGTLGPELAKSLAGRGGGGAGLYQGKAERLDNRQAAVEWLACQTSKGCDGE